MTPAPLILPLHAQPRAFCRKMWLSDHLLAWQEPCIRALYTMSGACGGLFQRKRRLRRAASACGLIVCMA